MKLEGRDGVRQKDQLLLPGPLSPSDVAAADQGGDALGEMTGCLVTQDLEGTGDVAELVRYLAKGRRAAPLVIADEDGLLHPRQLPLDLLQGGGAQLGGEEPGAGAGALRRPAMGRVGLKDRFDTQQLRRQGLETHGVLAGVGHGQLAESVRQIAQPRGQSPRVGHL